MSEQTIIHATCVAVKNKGVLLCGPSGSGKSDLALRLIEEGALLVSDDQVILKTDKGQVAGSPPSALEGLLEVRGVGICTFKFQQSCPIHLIVNLEPGCKPVRMPDLEDLQTGLLGVNVSHFQLDPFHASAVVKIMAMLNFISSKSVNKDKGT